jgi:SAM-dependent methyltransferase
LTERLVFKCSTPPIVIHMEQNTLYDRPDLYDLLAPPDPILERFYVEMAHGRDGPVLDLACGTGRLTIPLARAGKQVTGGDLSPHMLQRARLSAEAAAAKVDFVQLDIREFELNGRTFGTIIVAMNSALHLHSLDDFKGFFQSVARHLSRHGRLVFDVFVPSVAFLNSDPDKRQFLGRVTHDSLGHITVEETVRYDPITQIRHTNWYWSTDAEKDFWVTPLKCVRYSLRRCRFWWRSAAYA